MKHVECRRRNTEDFADLANSRFSPVTDDIGYHGRPIPAVLLIHVLDNFFPAPVLDVEIDIRRFGPFAGYKTLEQEVHLNRIDGRDS